MKLMERFVALILIIIAAPFLILIMLIIRIESKGNPVFTQKRVGRGGKLFTIYKLRTMRVGKEATHINSPFELKRHENCRVTFTGKFLRKYHVDELLQLWNIIKKEMVFVGPRPITPSVIGEYYAPQNENAFPGITGLTQISEYKKEGYDFCKLDKWYSKKRSLSLDVYIVFMTIVYIAKKVKNKNLYE